MSNLKLGEMTSQSSPTDIGTGYDLGKKVPLELDLFAQAQVSIHASLLEVQLTNITGATKVYCCISRDPEGDNYCLTETLTEIQGGLTTVSKGTAQIRLDVIIRDVNDKILYLHLKTNAGSIDIVSAGLTFRY